MDKVLKASWTKRRSPRLAALAAAVIGSTVNLSPSWSRGLAMWPGVLLTGPPGIGKSTACRRVVELCEKRGVQVEGFLTEELRERGTRVGFDLVGVGAAKGQRAPLARSGRGAGDGPRVGKYSVTLSEFEDMALPILDRVIDEAERSQKEGAPIVCVIDEIGKMELFSSAFVSRMRRLLRTRPAPALITVALRGQGLISESKQMRGFELIELCEENREGSPNEIILKLLGSGAAAEPSAALAPSIKHTLSRPPSTKIQPTGSRWRPRKQSSTATDESAIERSQTQLETKDSAIVLWLRNELRLADNPLLSKGIELCGKHQLALAVCLDPREFDPSICTAFGSPKVGEARRRFLQEALVDLQASVAKRGSQLLVCDAAPEDALLAIARGCQASVVLAAGQFCPEEKDAEARVAKALEAANISLELLNSASVSTIFGPGDFDEAGISSDPSAFPEDFQTFYGPMKASMQRVCEHGLLDAPETLPPCPVLCTPPPGLRPAQLSSFASDVSPLAFQGGEAAAHQRLKSWLASGGLGRYKTTFRRLLGDYSSRLSPHLSIGCISPCRLAAEVLKAAGPRSSVHVDHFTYELGWRDFFRHAAQRWGSALFKLEGPNGGRTSTAGMWTRDEGLEERWRRGRTGFPLIDAAMRELLSTGFMGNLARQFTAAFLVEELGIDWRVGADWFEAMLVDYDPHSNWGQWARSAGVAPTNEAKRRRVGGTRYYDIAMGLPNGEAAQYIRTWIPELAALPDKYLFAPWLLSSAERASLESYPEPCTASSLQRYFEAAGLAVKGKGKGHGKDSQDSSKGDNRRWGSRSQGKGRQK